ncbi:MAG: nucleotidyltransferase domain-containing protein [Oscillospiraceae bacterium]|nr:nucleotidyltransferase domain-containing protein [Oscillospiraceae bacterium]
MIYTLDELREKIKPIAEKYELPAVYIFGSYARGEATEDSDVDVLIDGRSAKLRGMMIGALYVDLEEALQKELSLVEETALRTPRAKQRPWFYENVNRDKVMVYGRN